MKFLCFVLLAAIGLLMGYPSLVLGFCFDDAAKKYNINPLLLKAIADVESNNHPYAINVNKNGSSVKAVFTSSKKTAIDYIRHFERTGYNYDVGLGQINIRNIKRYGMDSKELLNPCKNLHASAMLLKGLIERYGYTWEAVWRYNGSKDYAVKVYKKIKVLKKDADISK